MKNDIIQFCLIGLQKEQQIETTNKKFRTCEKTLSKP